MRWGHICAGFVDDVNVKTQENVVATVLELYRRNIEHEGQQAFERDGAGKMLVDDDGTIVNITKKRSGGLQVDFACVNPNVFPVCDNDGTNGWGCLSAD